MTSSTGSSGNKGSTISGQKTSSGIKSSSGSNLMSSGGTVGKNTSTKSFSSSLRDKARFKPGDKSFLSKAADLRKTVESDSEKTFKLLAQASSVGTAGMIKQLDKRFQIPKLSARVNADNTDKPSVDKVDSVSSKSLSEAVSRSLADPTVSSTSVVPKIDEAANLVVYGTSSSSSAPSVLESVAPTNLSMQPGDKVNAGEYFLNFMNYK